MAEINPSEAVELAVCASFDRLRRDQLRVCAGLVLALEKLGESAFNPAFRLKDLPASCGLTSSWLWRHFEIELGATPKGYLTRMRLETAKVLLDAEQPPVAQVAAWVGYRSAEVFIIAFRVWSGETPGAYRQRRLQEKAGRPAAPPEPPELPPSAAQLALEEIAAAMLAGQWLHFTREERLEIIEHGFTVSPPTRQPDSASSTTVEDSSTSVEDSSTSPCARPSCACSAPTPGSTHPRGSSSSWKRSPTTCAVYPKRQPPAKPRRWSSPPRQPSTQPAEKRKSRDADHPSHHVHHRR